jgi:hypothetical protein
MIEPKRRTVDDCVGVKIYPDMPNYVGTEAAFLAAVEIGIADLDAGRTVSFEEVAAEYRHQPGARGRLCSVMRARFFGASNRLPIRSSGSSQGSMFAPTLKPSLSILQLSGNSRSSVKRCQITKLGPALAHRIPDIREIVAFRN